MGMVVSLVAVSDTDIEKIVADPPLAWKLFAPDDPEIYEESRKQSKKGFFSRLFSAKTPEPAPASVHIEPHFDTDLDKAWHGIHYLLTGTAWQGDFPLNFLVQGGVPSGEEEVGLGPARFFTSSEVRDIRDALAPMTPESLRSRFDPQDMMRLEIYPEIWDRDPEDDDTLGYCIDNFVELKAFIEKAYTQHLGIAISVG
jgi:hypothetical protein